MPAGIINLPAAAERSKARQGCWIFGSSCFNVEKLSEKDEATRLGLYIFFSHIVMFLAKAVHPVRLSMMKRSWNPSIFQ
jgi:hypothetical protein